MSTARVGIGTATPTHLLQVFAASAPELRLGDATTTIQMYTAAAEAVLGTVGSHPFVFRTNATERMRILSTGNVGIGTSTPSYKLTVGNPTADASQSQTYAGNNDQIGVNASYVPSGTFPRFFDIVASGAADGSNGESNIRFFTNGVTSTTKTEKLRILANGGITFNGDTAAANALDDYEEGTFTPSVAGATTAGTATYTQRVGVYTKIGRQVSVQIDLGWNSGTGTGLLTITGLPFADTSNTNPAITIGFFDGITLTALNYALAYIPSLSSIIDIVQTPVGGGTLTSVPYDAAGRVILNVTYTA
jgi:hypothetical protein